MRPFHRESFIARKTKDFAAVIRAVFSGNRKLREAEENERLNMEIASAIVAARDAAGLTQAPLAERAGMQQSAIARMENADYQGHSISSLKRIAASVGKRLAMQFVPASGLRSSAAATKPLVKKRGKLPQFRLPLIEVGKPPRRKTSSR